MPITVKPKGYRVLVEEIGKRDTGPILLPDNTKIDGVFRHKIIALGDPLIFMNGNRHEIDLKVGDEVMFTKSTSPGPKEMFNGRLLGVVDVGDIFCVLEGECERPAPRVEVATRVDVESLRKAAKGPVN